MFASLFLVLAIVASSTPAGATVGFDEGPDIVIPVGNYDFGRPDMRRRIENKIHHAAISVCDRGYHGLSYSETIACVKSAIADGEAQLGKLLAHSSRTAPVTSAVVISLPAN